MADDDTKTKDDDKAKPVKTRTLSDLLDQTGSSRRLSSTVIAGLAGSMKLGGSAQATLNALVLGPQSFTVTPSSVADFPMDPDTLKKTRELEGEITRLRQERDRLLSKLNDADKLQSTVAKLESTVEDLSKKEKLAFLLPKVNGVAQKLLYKSDEFQKEFLDEENDRHVFVMSVDIRRSTELMAKARSPQEFAIFMTDLCAELVSIVKDNYGVVDKFTGDGVLAFFPDFFSEDDAGWYAVSAADLCHKVFQEKYKAYRTSFRSVLADVGLGIGIDYVVARLVQMVGNLTVVGIPVVYACRMSGAKAGTTLLNQPAYEMLNEKFSPYCFFKETEIDIKNEGLTLAYEVRRSGKRYDPKGPSWAGKVQSEVDTSPKPADRNSES